MRRHPPSPYESPPHPASGAGVMHDYNSKYGTLSGGSALSQSMRYAEPWLYASVSARSPGPRPSILTYPEPTVILGTPIVMCACKDFLSGTTRSKKSSSAVCKKCGGSRKTPWNINSSTAIRGFGTVRLSQPKTRPELPTLEDLKDPYDMMRKSRLAAVSSTLRVPFDGKYRAKSTSPSGRRRTRSKSPPPRHRSPDTLLVDMKSPMLTNLSDANDLLARKSILECDVNPYELITKYLKNRNPGNSRFYLEEDELSDNISEHALDDTPMSSGRSRTKCRGSQENLKPLKVPNTSSRPKRGFLNGLTAKREESQRVESLKPIPGGVSIGGQRIRLFNTADPLPSVHSVNEFVSDSDENEEELEEEIYDIEKHNAWFAENSFKEPSPKSQPAKHSSSPKRPPRKQKACPDLVNKKETSKNNETGNKNRVNFALDVPIQNNRRSNSLTSAVSLEIKSILKKPNSTLKPNSGPSNARGVTAFSNGAIKQESTAKPTSRNLIPSKTKNLPTASRNTNQQLHNRRKKQVQFIVNDCANTGPSQDASMVEVAEEVPSSVEITLVDPVATEQTGEIPRFQFFGDHRADAHAVNQIPLSTDNIYQSGGDNFGDQDGRQNACSLQRSLSDCMSPGSESGSKFNDTMRLRLRAGRRDSREAFPEEERKRPERRVLSPGRPRPKEPPPPPPPPALDSGIGSSSEIPSSETIPLHQVQPELEDNYITKCPPPPPPPPPPRQIFPFSKEEIEEINQSVERRILRRPRSSASSPERQPLDTSRKTSTTLPLIGNDSLWRQEESVVNNNLIPLTVLDENIPPMEAFSSVTEVYEALEKNTKEITKEETLTLTTPDRAVEYVKLIVPSATNNDLLPMKEESEQTCTVVTVSSPTQSFSVTNPTTFHNRKTSIIITGKENNEEKVNRTSVVIGEYESPTSNKVTINVGSFSNQSDNNKTDTSSPQPVMKNNFKSNITIGSNDNKSRTLVILEPSNIPNTTETLETKEENTAEESHKVQFTSIDSQAEEEMNNLIRSNIDPVEAARKNIVPHVCGLGKTSQEEIKDKHINKPVFGKLNSVVEEINAETNVEDDRDTIFNTLSSLESEENIDDDVFALKDDTDENSDCYVCAKKLKKGSDDEEKIGIEFDSDENHYEVIRDPIYEEISDTPPPLPLSPPPSSADTNDSIPTRSIFEGASKYDILNYLETAKVRGIVAEHEDDLEMKSPDHSRISSLDLSSRISQLSNASDSSEDSCNLIMPATDTSSISSDKVRKSSVEIERNDSGVGSESSKCSRSRWQHLTISQQHACEDCEQPVETQVTDSGLMFAPLVCRKCAKRRSERREIITEIVETEEKYGRDLKIMLDEFYRPMLVAGLLTPDQLSAIFLNVEELLENNAMLAEKLRDALDIAIDQGDEDLLTVNIGSIFLDAVPMLHAFESYCTRQGAASLLLANLEKEKELLRIFLRVSQMENSVLRRMNLNSFLMVPVQRVTKYPLLLARLYRVTPAHLKSRDTLRLAQGKIELHLEHINSLAKDISTTKLWRRISIINGRRSNSETDMITIKLRKVAVDVLEWNHDEVRFAMEGKLLYTQPTDNNWRRGRTIKLTPVNTLLVTLGKPTEDYQPDTDELLAFPRKNGIRDATLILVKEKSGRYGLLREPLFLDRCIICCEADIEDYFEIQELATKDTYLFKAEDGEQTKRWFRQLQYHAQGLGAWRKRRNALANIMINGMQLRT